MKRFFILLALGGTVFLSSFSGSPALSASCNFAAFLSCRDTFNLQGCIDACPYVTKECPAGTPPNTECKETDPACSDGCWDMSNSHGASCAASAGCTMEQIQILLQGGTIEDDQNTPPSQPPPPPPPVAPTAPPGQFSSPPPQTPEGLKSKSEPEIFQKVDEYGSFYEILWNSPDIKKTRALINRAPRKIDDPAPNVRALKEGEMGLIYSLTGDAEVLLPNGEILEIKSGRYVDEPIALPEGAQIFTDDETIVHVRVFGGEIVVDSSEEYTLNESNIDQFLTKTGQVTPPDHDKTSEPKAGSEGRDVWLKAEWERRNTLLQINKAISDKEWKPIIMPMRFKWGRVNVPIEKGEFTSEPKISTPHAHASPSGTDFTVVYDEATESSIFEIYDGSITVTHDASGKNTQLATAYGDSIKGIIVTREGEFTPYIGIPGDEWDAMQEQSQTEAADDISVFNTAGALAIIATIVFAGLIAFFLKRKMLMK